MMELWRDIPGFEGLYQVSSAGRVKSLARTVYHPKGNIALKERIMRWARANISARAESYPRVTLSKNGKCKLYRVHILVLTAFAGPCPDGCECRHLNDDPTDNRWPENLVWGTQSENIKDRVRNGGTMKHRAKLTEQQVKEIRELKGRLTQGEIGSRYGVTGGAVSAIHVGRNWR